MESLSAEERVALLAEASATGRTDVINQLVGANLVQVGARVTWPRAEPGKNNTSAATTTALHVACAEGQVDCVRALLKLGARVDALDANGKLPLQLARPSSDVAGVFQQEMLQNVATGNLERVRELLRAGVEPNRGDGTDADSSVLHWAASFGQSREMVKVLVDAGARLDRRNSKGQTALHEACENGHIASARALIELGSDPNVEDAQKRRPIDSIRDDSVKAELAKELATGSRRPPPPSHVATGEEAKATVLHALGKKLADSDEVAELRRMNEEKDMTIVALRETVETLLQKDGVLKYISKLQEEYRALAAQLERVEDHKEHLQSMYLKCDSELEGAMKENAELRAAMQRQEDAMLDAEALSEPFTSVSAASQSRETDEHGNPGSETKGLALRRGTSGAGASVSSSATSDLRETLDLVRLERDRLAHELESERRLRFSEARLHIGHARKLREELKSVQALLKRSVVEDQRRIVASELNSAARELAKANGPLNEEKERGFFTALFQSLFGNEEDDEEDDDDGEDEDSEIDDRDSGTDRGGDARPSTDSNG